MKTRERLLFMALGGLLVLAGMIVGQFMFSSVQAQDGAQDATFKTVRCERLVVGDSSNRQAVMVASFNGNGAVFVHNKAGKLATALAVSDRSNGVITTSSNSGKELVTLTASDDNSTSETLGGAIVVNNIHGVRVAALATTGDKDGVIVLYDRYGDLGWIESGKQ